MPDSADPHSDALDLLEVLESIGDGVVVLDASLRVLFWNRAAEKLSGCSAPEMTGRCCADGLLCHPETSRELCAALCPARDCLRDGERRELVTFLRHSDGHRLPVQVRFTPLRRDGQPFGVVQQITDMTPRVGGESAADAGQPHDWTDPQTRLPSMMASAAQLRDRVDQWNLTAELFSVVLVLLDGLDDVAGRFGQEARDQLLFHLARALHGAVRQHDFVGCWFGNQFVLVLPQCSSPQATRIARQARTAFVRAHIGQPLHITKLRFGISTPCGNDTPTALVARAVADLEQHSGAEAQPALSDDSSEISH